MFSAIRSAATKTRVSARAFSTSLPARHDVAKLTLIGFLGKEPEVRQTKNDKEFVAYTVATTNYPPPPPNPDGSRAEPTTSWHRVLSFNDSSNRYLTTLKKGSRVYVEASYELREPEQGADPATPMGQRQIFLRHESIRVLTYPKNTEADESHYQA